MIREGHPSLVALAFPDLARKGERNPERPRAAATDKFAVVKPDGVIIVRE
jgi:hypothetical protein